MNFDLFQSIVNEAMTVNYECSSINHKALGMIIHYKLQMKKK